MELKTAEMELLMIGDSNWDYYWDEAMGSSFSIAKEKERKAGCKDSIFGGQIHVCKAMLRDIQRNPKLWDGVSKKGLQFLLAHIADRRRYVR